MCLITAPVLSAPFSLSGPQRTPEFTCDLFSSSALLPLSFISGLMNRAVSGRIVGSVGNDVLERRAASMEQDSNIGGDAPHAQSPNSHGFVWRLAFRILVSVAGLERKFVSPSGEIAGRFDVNNPTSAFFVQADERTYFMYESVAAALDNVMGTQKNWSGQFVHDKGSELSLAGYVLFLANLSRTDHNAYLLIAPLGISGLQVLESAFRTPGNILMRFRSGRDDESYVMTLAHERTHEYLRNDLPSDERELLIKAYKAVLNNPDFGPTLKSVFTDMEAYREGVETQTEWDELWTWTLWPGDHKPTSVHVFRAVGESIIAAIERGSPEKGQQIRMSLQAARTVSEQWARGTLVKLKLALERSDHTPTDSSDDFTAPPSMQSGTSSPSRSWRLFFPRLSSQKNRKLFLKLAEAA